MTSISGWAGNAVGIIVVGLCFVAARFVNHLPSATHPWVHRFLIVAMYAGATAVLITPVGQFFIHLATMAAGWFGGFGTGLGKAAIIIAGFFLLASVIVALIKVPSAAAATTAALLVFVLALEPGGFLHQFYVTTAVPGQQFAAQMAAWMGG